jgi:hypothetical protein
MSMAVPLHGQGGEWRVEHPRMRWQVLDALRMQRMRRGIPHVARFQHGRQYRRRLFPGEPEGWRALVVGARLSQADPEADRISRW